MIGDSYMEEKMKALKEMDKGGSKIAKKMMTKAKRQAGCSIARSVVMEAIEEYEEGDMSWMDTVAEITKTLKSFDPEDYKNGDEDEE